MAPKKKLNVELCSHVLAEMTIRNSVGEKTIPVFVPKGLLRKGERVQILQIKLATDVEVIPVADES